MQAASQAAERHTPVLPPLPQPVPWPATSLTAQNKAKEQTGGRVALLLVINNNPLCGQPAFQVESLETGPIIVLSARSRLFGVGPGWSGSPPEEGVTGKKRRKGPEGP